MREFVCYTIIPLCIALRIYLTPDRLRVRVNASPSCSCNDYDSR